MPAEPDRFRLLTRLFVRRGVENDLLSPQEGLQAGLGGALALLLAPGLLVCAVLLLKYTRPYASMTARDVASWSDKSFFMTLAMVVMAGLAAVQWDAVRFDRRDAQVLLPLPVPLTTILGAKVAALGALFGVGAAALAGLPAAVYPLVMLASSDAGLLEALRWVIAHAIAGTAAAGFGFFGVLALHGVLALVCGPRLVKRIQVWVQGGVVFVSAVTLLLLPLVASLARPLKNAGGPTLYLTPPLWFVGLYQTLGGRSDAEWRRLAVIGALVAVGLTTLAIASLLVGYRRQAAATLETSAGPARREGGAHRTRWLVAVVAGRHPGCRAIFSFTIRTFARSPRHRLILSAFLALGCAIAAVVLTGSMWHGDDWGAPSAAAVLSVQNVLAFLLVAAAASGAAVPSELAAAWTFRLLAPRDPRPWVAGLRRAVLAGGIVPLLVLLLPLDAILLGWRAALVHSVLGLLMSALLVEVMFLRLRRVPFACALPPDSGSPNPRWAFYWFGFSLYAFTLAQIEAWALGEPWGPLTMIAVALAALLVAVAVRTWRPDARLPLTFDAQADWATQRLDLSA